MGAWTYKPRLRAAEARIRSLEAELQRANRERDAALERVAERARDPVFAYSLCLDPKFGPFDFGYAEYQRDRVLELLGRSLFNKGVVDFQKHDDAERGMTYITAAIKLHPVKKEFL